MTHLSEACRRLSIKYVQIEALLASEPMFGLDDVCLLVLPAHSKSQRAETLVGLSSLVERIAAHLGENATLITLGEPIDLVHVHASVSPMLHYQLWVAIKRQISKVVDDHTALPEGHFGALVHTRYEGSLRHTKTRLAYTYCPACDKTTKDYGGKKHTYNSYGTLISDVWRDIPCDLEGNLEPVVIRFADLFGLEPYQDMVILDCRDWFTQASVPELRDAERKSGYAQGFLAPEPELAEIAAQSELVVGDCLEHLRLLPANSVDFAFIDPPYNLGKNYNDYADDLSIKEYFAWCDAWITETARILQPGRTLALLNIPLWAIRHFLHMETVLTFQSWIAWDALSFPVRRIMPAHYAILCFSKGQSRPLPGLTGLANSPEPYHTPKTFDALQPLADGFCLRAKCVKERAVRGIDDRMELTDLWSDIHRLKHNSRRVDHPCQLPPGLMYRLISLFTQPGETVLDCFNGAGTTTLTAHQLHRRYIGIELSRKYHALAAARHEEIVSGLDPFRKAKRKLTEKNSHVERMPKRKYEVPKKRLQLEVRRVAQDLGHLPSRDEMIQFGAYPIRYYDEYFVSWGEVCAAARHDGMTETREANNNGNGAKQLSFFDLGSEDARRRK
ncbi:MAG: site-specific DNA-methyltransferase [Anaerolineales bacterium]|nr:site-specific DNA-methyltransferase [Anaerolineales bacterium]